MPKSTSIAIVGAGFAGLNAAYQLQKVGYAPVVYEASERVGGRVQSQQGLLHDELTTELGAEFIDEHHADMLMLVDELGLETIKRDVSGRQPGRHYFAHGAERSPEEIREAVAPYLPQILADCDRLEAGDHAAFDKMTAAEYLDQFDMPGWLRSIWDTAMNGMYGLEADKQTAVNLLWLRPSVKDGEFLPFGDPGQTRSVKGGNNRLAQELAARLQKPVRFNKRLSAVRATEGSPLELQFSDGETVQYDAVIIAIPFSVLRDVTLDVAMPQTLKQFIDELEYGTNAKVLFGFQEAIWSHQGSSGSVSSDEGPFTTWDNGESQGADVAGLTFYLGGDIGVEVGGYSAEQLTEKFLPAYDKVLTGAAACAVGQPTTGIHWPTFDLARGSYACYQPNQWEAFIKHHVYSEEMGLTGGVGVDNLIFAGEHLSADFQGYMNGALQTGRLAAQAMIVYLEQGA